MTLDEAVNTLTPDELQVLNNDPQLLSEFKSKYGEESKSVLRKAWDALAVPEKKSREGLKMMSGATSVEPTGNMFRDVALNTPSIAIDTLADTAPGFISRGSLLTAGALKGAQIAAPAMNAVGRFIGRTAESTSGLGYKTPGVLAEAVNDPSLIFGKGLGKAREAYKAIQNVNQVSPDLQAVSNQRPFVMKALKFAQDGKLTPDEALEARKALDALDNVPDVFRKQTRAIFDALAKQKFAEADKAYSRAVKSEALRSFWGINKGGTPSIVKGGLTTALPVTAPMFSPMVQGGLATGVGVVRKLGTPFLENPRVGLLGEPILERFR